MKNLLRIEEVALFAISIYALYFLKADWWFYLLLFIGPDISMLGYLAGNNSGAILYNFFHHKAVAIVVFMFGFIFGQWIFEVIGIVLFGHSSMDRIFGYGLKYFTGFQHTHLGIIGSGKSNINFKKQ